MEKTNLDNMLAKGQDLLEKDNAEYAFTLLEPLISLYPDNEKLIHLFHMAAIKRTLASMPNAFKRVLPMFVYSPLLVVAYLAYLLESHALAIKVYEKLFKKMPLCIFLLEKLAQIYHKQDASEAERLCYEEILLINTRHTNTLKQLGKIYSTHGDLEKTRHFYEQLIEINPSDPETQEGMKNLAALEAIQKGKWDKKASFREKVQDIKTTEDLNKAQYEVSERVKKSLSQKSEKEIEFEVSEFLQELINTPTNISLAQKILNYANNHPSSLPLIEKKLQEHKNIDSILLLLAQLYLHSDSSKAEAYLQECLQINPENTSAKIELLSFKIKQTPNSPDIQAWKKNLLELKLKKYPSDFALHYEFGVLLKEQNNLDASISEFQTALNDPGLKLKTKIMLGLCFAEKNLFDLAQDQLRQALELAPQQMNEQKKEILYNLGLVYEHLNENQKAKECFKKIYLVDITYKDVKNKI